MKRLAFFLSGLAVFAALFTSCIEDESDPVATLTVPESENVSWEGAVLTVKVESSTLWNAENMYPQDTLAARVTSVDTSANEAKITVYENDDLENSREIEFIFYVKDKYIDPPIERTFVVYQTNGEYNVRFPDAADPQKDTLKTNFEGNEIAINIISNGSWSATADSGITVEPSSGTSSGTKPRQIKITYPDNYDFDNGAEYKVVFKMTEPGVEKSAGYVISQSKARVPISIEDSLRVVKLADGRWWMADNMRLLPKDTKPSADPDEEKRSGIYYPLDTDGNFMQGDDDIATYGLLYNFNKVMDTSNDITPNNISSLNGKRGICPAGWYVPKKEDGTALFKAYGTKEIAVGKLQEAGFLPDDFYGSLTAPDSAAPLSKSPTYAFIFSSNIKSEPDGNNYIIINDALVPAETSPGNWVLKAGEASIYSAVSLRCIKNKL